MSAAVECHGLRRVYRSRSALGAVRESVGLAELDLSIQAGQIFGLLGRNGAGKTTTIKILSTLLSPTAGTARVAGYDVVRHANEVRRHIGFVFGGDRGLYWRLSGIDNLRYFGALYGLPWRDADRRARELLARVGLAADADRRVEHYSRGMKQRLHIARGLLTNPDVLCLDEPTLGVDPMGARDLRTLIEELQDARRTILLTTHYMFEADVMCDRIAIIDGGRLLLEDTPANIKRTAPDSELIEVEALGSVAAGVELLRALSGVLSVDVNQQGEHQRVRIRCEDAGALVSVALRALSAEAQISTTTIRQPTLEDAYVGLLDRLVGANSVEHEHANEPEWREP